MRKALMHILILAALALTTLVLSCERRPLYYVEEPGLKVIVKVIWQVEVYPDGIKPSGVTMYFFRDGKFFRSETSANVDSCAVQLEPGRYKLFMITQSPEEYSQMEFNDMTDFEKAFVSVLETRSKWYTKADDEVLIGNPEPMAAGVSEEFEVTEDMVENYQHYNYQLRMRQRQLEASQRSYDPELTKAETMVNYYTIRVPVHPRNIVSQYWVTIYSNNADVLHSVRASTSGMARNYLLTEDRTGPEEGTQFITQWSLSMDDPFTRVGHVDGIITTFGFPNGEMPSPQRDSTLNVAALLIDNQTVENYVFNVGDKIAPGIPSTGYRSLYRLILGSVETPAIHPPDVQPADESSGFDATVQDWDDGGTLEVGM